MITYQKVYTDHVHSSTLMSQFTQLWKNHLMCDAELIVGDTVIKAHRLVLVASCAILQSHDNASTGSVLEVTLPSDIQSQSVYMFLEFLYQGHMILTEENIQSIERIARLLHVEDVLKCCSDFTKTLKSEHSETYQDLFNFHDLVGVNHVRVTNFIKSESNLSSDSQSTDDSQNKYGCQRSTTNYVDSSENVVKQQPIKSVSSSVSFVTSPSNAKRRKINLDEQQNQVVSRIRSNSSDLTDLIEGKTNVSQHSIIDLSDEGQIISRSGSSNQLTSQGHNSDHQSRLYVDENSGSNLNSRRRHSDQNTCSSNSVETSSSNNHMTLSARSHDNFCRSLSDETLNPNNLRNATSSSYAAQFGFAMPVIPSTLWADKSMVQHFSSQQNQNPRCSSNNSITSSSSSKASTSHPVTRVNNDFSDLPMCLEQDDSQDNRLVLDVSEIDLSMIKSENVEEPLDLHVKGVIQAAEHLGTMNTSEEDNTVHSQTEHFPVSHHVYNSPYQTSTNNDWSRQWSSQLQSAMIKKRPTSLSTNVRKIIQDLSLNKRALASPAALGNLAVGNHKPIRMPGKNNYKVCSLCYRNKIRTKSGYYVYSYYKCSVCDVPLCIGRRKCFLEYHKEAESTGNN